VPADALALLLLAAALHAGWNLIVKLSGGDQVFTWLAVVVGATCFFPLIFIGDGLTSRTVPYILASAAFEMAYFLALTRAYRLGDFSLVYPIARGSAPAFLAIWATTLLDEELSTGGIVGLAVLVLGLMVVGSGLWLTRGVGSGIDPRAVLAALLVALCISAYTAVDGAAVQFTSPGPYTAAVMALTCAATTPFILATTRRDGRSIRAVWRANRFKICLVGILTMTTYLLVLVAYTRAQVAYAGAVREISVVFAAIVGWRFLGEPFGIYRTAGAALIFTGTLIIAIAG
jgi:drug/metabolite transporter (DMT)-like permease